MLKFRNKMGNDFIKAAKSGKNPQVAWIYKEIKNQGATDDDIKAWLNAPKEKMLQKMQEREERQQEMYASWINVDGMSKENANLKYIKTFPIFDIYETGRHYNGKDEALPYELMNRVDVFMGQSSNLVKNMTEIKKASSMNAFIRELIESGQL